MTDHLDERFEAVRHLCLLLAFQKPRAMEITRTGERHLVLRSHKDNIGQYIGSKGAHFKALEHISHNLGFTFEVQNNPDKDAFTPSGVPMNPQDILEDIASLIAGKRITAEVRKVKDSHKFVCAVPRHMFTERLQHALDVIFYASGYASGSEAGVILLPE